MRWLVTIAVLAGVFISAASAVADELEDGCAHGRAAALAQLGPNRVDPDAGGIAGAGDDTDVTHYHLDIAIDPVLETISGSNTMSVTSLVDGLTQFGIRLRSNFAISAVQVNGVAAAWTRVDTVKVTVTLDRAYAAGESFDVYVAYNGVPVSRGFGSIEFRTHGPSSVPLVYTLSETWFAYTWWPVKDSGENSNRDKATADLWFTVPEAYSVASNGVLVQVNPLGAGDGLHRFEWATNYATSEYLFCFSMTNYVRFSDTYTYPGGSMPLEFFIYPESDTTGNRNAWRKTVDMLGVFSARYGEYPFIAEKYGIYQFGFGGGMEHQTMTGQGTFSESVTAHELGHQWWGDMITCATWHDIWLNEGFATYSEAIWEEFKPGSSGKAALLAHMANRRPSSVNGSVYVYDATNFNRIFSSNFSYRKGGWVLHMLRHVIGDPAFFGTLAAYRDAYAYGAATTEDFIAVAEQVSGRDLDWFFNPWIYEVGAPDYDYGWRAIQVNGQHYVELYVRQVQSASYPLFTMPVDVVMTVDGTSVTSVVTNDALVEHFVIPVSGPATGVLLDPEEWILKTGADVVSFVEGPPKIVAAAPGPSAAITPAESLALTITFHKPVGVNSSHISLVGATGGAVAADISYDPGASTVTIEPLSVLAADEYTLTVSDGVRDVAANLALDGEIGTGPAAFPSGDGLPGGAASWTFTVVPADLVGDMNCDGLIDFFDIDGFLLALFDPAGYAAAYPGCELAHADLDADGVVSFFDIDPFLALLFD